MTDIDEAMLIALVDGELDDVTRRRVERAMAEDPALAERVAMHRRLRERLAGHYAPIAQEPLPEAMRALVEDSARVVPLARPAPRWRGWVTGGAIAASLVLGLGLGRLSGGEGGPIGVQNGVMIAQGSANGGKAKGKGKGKGQGKSKGKGKGKGKSKGPSKGKGKGKGKSKGKSKSKSKTKRAAPVVNKKSNLKVKSNNKTKAKSTKRTSAKK